MSSCEWVTSLAISCQSQLLLPNIFDRPHCLNYSNVKCILEQGWKISVGLNSRQVQSHCHSWLDLKKIIMGALSKSLTLLSVAHKNSKQALPNTGKLEAACVVTGAPHSSVFQSPPRVSFTRCWISEKHSFSKTSSLHCPGTLQFRYTRNEATGWWKILKMTPKRNNACISWEENSSLNFIRKHVS